MSRLLIFICISSVLFASCRSKTARIKTVVQYLIVNRSTDKVWVYFRHRFPPEKYKENTLVVDTGKTGICAQFSEVYTTEYLSQFVCGDYAEELLIYKVNSPDTLKTRVIANQLWSSSSYNTEDNLLKTCTYQITDADF